MKADVTTSTLVKHILKLFQYLLLPKEALNAQNTRMMTQFKEKAIQVLNPELILYKRLY
jgi:hypothetical protein